MGLAFNVVQDTHGIISPYNRINLTRESFSAFRADNPDPVEQLAKADALDGINDNELDIVFQMLKYFMLKLGILSKRHGPQLPTRRMVSQRRF